MVTIEDFAKLEFKVGTVISAEEIEGSDRLLKLQVDFGPSVILNDSEESLANARLKAPEGSEQKISNELRDSSALPQNDSIEASKMVSVIPSEERVEESLNQDLSATVEMTEVQEDQPNEIRQILSGIKQWYKPEDLVGKQFVFITNLAPRKMMGLESQGMIMAAEGEEKPIPLTVSEKVPNGAKIR